jgi:hypothetical protein
VQVSTASSSSGSDRSSIGSSDSSSDSSYDTTAAGPQAALAAEQTAGMCVTGSWSPGSAFCRCRQWLDKGVSPRHLTLCLSVYTCRPSVVYTCALTATHNRDAAGLGRLLSQRGVVFGAGEAPTGTEAPTEALPHAAGSGCTTRLSMLTCCCARVHACQLPGCWVLRQLCAQYCPPTR